ncbi:MAG: hypothetical protein ABI855_06360 [Bacteroidota bacterium]
MINYLKHSEINKTLWDDCISKSSNGIVYAYSWYLDLACPGWDALIENNYESVFPLTKNKKYGIEYLYPPFFTHQLGLFSKNKITEERINDFLTVISEKFSFIEINLNTENNFSTKGFTQKKNLTHHLNLNNPYREIYKRYNENLKRNLKKATKHNQKIIKDADAKKIITLFRENKGKEISTWKNKNYETLLKLIETAKEKNLVSAYGVTDSNFQFPISNRLIAGALFIESNGKTIFLFSGSNNEAKEKLSMPLLMDAFIKDHAEKNLILDFEGSNNLNLARFYKSFGAEEIIFLQIKKNRLPYLLKWIKK